MESQLEIEPPSSLPGGPAVGNVTSETLSTYDDTDIREDLLYGFLGGLLAAMWALGLATSVLEFSKERLQSQELQRKFV